MRKWVAPRAGTVRVEGRVALAGPDHAAVEAMILDGDREAWPPRAITKARPQSHDLTLTVRQGDAISFIVKRSGEQSGDKAYLGSRGHLHGTLIHANLQPNSRQSTN